MYIYLSVSGIINFLLASILGLIVISKNKKNIINTTLGLTCFFTALWSYFFTFYSISYSKENSLLFFQLSHIATFFLVVSLLHFVLSFLEIKNIYWSLIIKIGYIFSLFLAACSFSALFVADMVPQFSFGFWAVPGILYYFYLLFVLGYLIAATYLLFSCKNKQPTIKKERIKYIITGVLLIYVSLGTFFPLWYNTYFPPYFNILTSGFIFFITLAIIYDRLMDIRIIFRKSSVYLLTFITLTLEVLLFSLFLDLLNLNNNAYLNESLLLILAAASFEPIRKFFYLIANKYFFPSLYNAQDVIAHLSSRLKFTLNINDLFNSITNIFSSTFRPKSTALLAYSGRRSEYKVVFGHNFSINNGKKISWDAYLHEAYIMNNRPVIVDELEVENDDRSRAAIPALKELNISVIIPLLFRKKVIGLFILGQKESKNAYNNEDLDTLTAVALQTAPAIDNALLFEKVARLNSKMSREVDKATADLRNANEELMRLDQAKSEFVSMASHQLLTPLTVIKGYISMLTEGNFGQLSSRQQDSLVKVFESNERLIRLIENLLNVSRIETGRLEYRFKIASLEKIVDNIVEELKLYAQNKFIKLNYIKSAEPMNNANIDEEKIRQVIMNLVDNAIKYTKQGTVTVSLKQIDSRLQFCVSDTGMGIKKEDLPNLFKKFSRGTGSAQVHTEGTGLGLYVAKTMLESHNGQLWAESDGEGLGSRFCFWLPTIN